MASKGNWSQPMKMFRLLIPLTLAIILLLSMAAGQEQQGEKDPFAGVTIEALSSITPPQLPDHALVLLRITLEPGSEIPAHGHPGAVALIVESGTFATEFTNGTGQVTRPTPDGGEPSMEEAATGSEVILQTGDSLAYDGHHAAHTMRNAGDVPVVLLISALLSAEEPGFQFEHEH